MPLESYQIKGFSLTGLLLTVTLLSVIAALALPGLSELIAGTRIRIESNALHHAIHLARRESLKRNVYVTLCRTRDATQCDHGAKWNEGWMVFIDNSERWPPKRLGSDEIVYIHKPTQNIDIKSNRTAFVIRTLAHRTTNGTFIVCDPQNTRPPLALVVSYTGRPRQRPAADVRTRLSC